VQVSRSLKFQLLKKQPGTATLKCHSKRNVFFTAMKVSAIYRILLSLSTSRRGKYPRGKRASPV